MQWLIETRIAGNYQTARGYTLVSLMTELAALPIGVPFRVYMRDDDGRTQQIGTTFTPNQEDRLPAYIGGS